MHDELWHVPSGNLVNTLRAQRDALAFVRRTYELEGRERAEEFALGTEDEDGESMQVAIGAELLARSLSEATERTASTPSRNLADR